MKTNAGLWIDHREAVIVVLADNHDKISEANRGKIESALNEVREAIKGSNAQAIKAASEKLNETWQAVSTELYKTASEKTRPGGGPTSGQGGTQTETNGAPEPGKNGEEPIIDAEVVDDRKAA
jgi:molecular chaperone DnaK